MDHFQVNYRWLTHKSGANNVVSGICGRAASPSLSHSLPRWRGCANGHENLIKSEPFWLNSTSMNLGLFVDQIVILLTLIALVNVQASVIPTTLVRFFLLWLMQHCYMFWIVKVLAFNSNHMCNPYDIYLKCVNSLNLLQKIKRDIERGKRSKETHLHEWGSKFNLERNKIQLVTTHR